MVLKKRKSRLHVCLKAVTLCRNNFRVKYWLQITTSNNRELNNYFDGLLTSLKFLHKVSLRLKTTHRVLIELNEDNNESDM